jgi:large conductance mechanosensitive channel
MLQGFKDFIMRGNVIDLAVAVVIGAAFTAVVTAIVDAIINPLIQLVYKPDPKTGAIGPVFTGLHGEVTFPLGNLITAVISFFAVALVVYFVFVMPMNRWKARQAAKAGVAEEPAAKAPTETELLIQIRDLLEAQNGAPAPTSTTPPTAAP